MEWFCHTALVYWDGKEKLWAPPGGKCATSLRGSLTWWRGLWYGPRESRIVRCTLSELFWCYTSLLKPGGTRGEKFLTAVHSRPLLCTCLHVLHSHLHSFPCSFKDLAFFLHVSPSFLLLRGPQGWETRIWSHCHLYIEYFISFCHNIGLRPFSAIYRIWWNLW